MNNPATLTASRSQSYTLVTTKVIRNTYLLLSMTLLFSATGSQE
jgi:FtsH-binding integral membrane protein